MKNPLPNCLEKHCEEFHGMGKQYPCPESNCEYVATTAGGLKSHGHFHDESKINTKYSHRCHLCPKTFANKDHLEKHLDHRSKLMDFI